MTAQTRTPTMICLPRNRSGRDFVVGDIHGLRSLLDAEIARVGFSTASDRLIAVGDLIDRGSESAAVTDLLEERWFHSVLGNHEASLLAAMSALPEAIAAGGATSRGETAHESTPSWRAGRHHWFHELALSRQRLIVQRLLRLPWALEIETADGLVGIVHAEVPERFEDWPAFVDALSRTRATGVRYEAVWNRHLQGIAEARAAEESSGLMADPDPERDYALSGVHHVIHGHSPSLDYAIHSLGNRYWIDCGAQDRQRTPPSDEHGEPRLCIVDIRGPALPL